MKLLCSSDRPELVSATTKQSDSPKPESQACPGTVVCSLVCTAWSYNCPAELSPLKTAEK